MDIFYTVYKVTNKLTGKIYVGSHKTRNLDDGYMGSGKILKCAQKKYGMHHFSKEVLFVFDNPAEMYAKEAEIVDERFLREENTYNLKIGGFGGFDYVNSLDLSDKRIRVAKSLAPHQRSSLKSRESSSKRMIEMHKTGRICTPTTKGFCHSEESKRKIGAANSKYTGIRNSQYGTKWITNDIINKKIPNGEEIPFGFRVGRKMPHSSPGGDS